ncbi:hypothetical protein PHLGIDRAFT_88268 [Phlebiopsis gigantea 11061_1 CR5-6]|uniref:HIG1 domain-containing protein n=1 Tax=Phlebiopsis gigantea (strain 11061_1 CR5-6) TaxID=745531 RepID=A0A0C3S0D3_PHLG1|nr:hypothetical protein PHLGIDRAFT_88268 [Phlebiopsis gigantea 11061_1 CR5-6]
MKIATQEELEGHHKATVRGAIEGTLAGFALALPAGYLANRRWPAFRAMPIQLKTLAAILIILPTYAIQAERRGVEFDESTWTGVGVRELQRVKSEEERHWEGLSRTQRVKEWAMKNQYKVILGSWAVSMGVAGAIVMANRYQTMPQKIVQARMWAQGLTVGVLIGAGVLTQSQRQERIEHRSVDHSWANVIEEQQKEDEDEAARKRLELPTRVPLQ